MKDGSIPHKHKHNVEAISRDTERGLGFLYYIVLLYYVPQSHGPVEFFVRPPPPSFLIE